MKSLFLGMATGLICWAFNLNAFQYVAVLLFVGMVGINAGWFKDES